MPLLGFVTGRRPSPNSKDGSIKEHLRSVSSKAPSIISVKSGKFEDFHTMDHGKRHSITSLLHPEKKSSQSPKIIPHKPAKLDLHVESPPLVSYNTPVNSSGALFSATLNVDVVDPEITLNSLDVRLLCSVIVKKPVHPNCPDCTTKITELKKWSFAKEPLRLNHGAHRFPFSYLFAGHLPATVHGSLVILDYNLVAEAKTSTGETLGLPTKSVIKLSRSVLPGNDKHSIRVFPPTNLTASVTLNPVIHPIGEFEVNLRVSGMVSVKEKQISRWRLRKMNWRIEEHQKMISPACPKHSQKLGGEGRGIQHEDVRTIGDGEIDQQKNPWKNDFEKGDVESIFNCAINPSRKPVCDNEAPNGLSITHNLIIEMVVAEEWAPRNRPRQITPTGAARILRTQFHLMLTDRPGLGISWDEETPPVYEDVPESPPHYASMTDYDLTSTAGSIEDFHLDPNTNQVSSATASSSGTARPQSSGSDRQIRTSNDIPTSARGRFVLNVEDLLSAPLESQRETVHEEEEDDMQVVQANAV